MTHQSQLSARSATVGPLVLPSYHVHIFALVQCVLCLFRIAQFANVLSHTPFQLNSSKVLMTPACCSVCTVHVSFTQIVYKSAIVQKQTSHHWPFWWFMHGTGLSTTFSMAPSFYLFQITNTLRLAISKQCLRKITRNSDTPTVYLSSKAVSISASHLHAASKEWLTLFLLWTTVDLLIDVSLTGTAFKNS